MGSLMLEYNRYLTYDEIVDALRRFHAKFPQLTRLYSIGKSYEGRDLWILELTNSATGPADDKPGYYVDGNHHAGEVTGSAVCLYTIDHLLTNYGQDETVTHLLDQIVFYVLPRVSPDGSELYLTTPHMLRSSVREWMHPEPSDFDGLDAADIDGDGHILSMRVRDDLTGTWKVSAQDPRLLIKRGPDDRQGPFYHLYPEGRVKNYDGYEVKMAPRKWGLDLNRNYPMVWRRETPGAGPYPFSEPETRSVGDFLLKQRNIAGALSYHTSGGWILRPTCTEADQKVPVLDLQAMKAIGDKGKELTGYPCISIFESFTFDKSRPSAGSFMDFIYDYLGVIAYATELWDINAQAGLPKRGMLEMIQQSEKQAEEAGVKLLKWNDEVLGGQGFVTWHPFEHPELGQVEIGGWLPKTVRQNAPAHLLEQECVKNMRFSLVQAQTLPRLAIRQTKLERIGEDIYRVTAAVENVGYLPTSGSTKAEQNKTAKPVTVTLAICAGGELLQGEVKKDLGHLPGRLGNSLASRRKVEWLVRLPAGGEVTVTAHAPRAGKVAATLKA